MIVLIIEDDLVVIYFLVLVLIWKGHLKKHFPLKIKNLVQKIDVKELAIVEQSRTVTLFIWNIPTSRKTLDLQVWGKLSMS